ncbi:protein TALPID3-like isoform X2 [Anneissia japonica]|uniref:protein TALPID3-like isoform X2 n=1 Tax=Anneissia japonica TaxID=1529436 RepID=UPI0014257FE5|nr:protein TALPID3-like isoform X2 [Anneissia japonica]
MVNQSLNNSADVSNQTSNSSTASEVLIRSTQVQAPKSSGLNLPTDRKLDTSGSSHSSTGSHRVRIKAKYLREVPSPFNAETDIVPEEDLKVPPALIRASPRDPTPVGNKPVPLLEHAVSHSMSSGRDVYAHKGERLPHSTLKFKSDSVLVQGQRNQHQLFPSQTKSDYADVKITQYKTGQRRKVMQENLKKQDSKAPIKRYVQPNFVNPMPAKEERDNVANITSDATTVAAMTAAAVAATAPFLKSQSDLEVKINGILEKLNSINSDRRDAETTAAKQPLKTDGEAERRLQELADLRLLQMEKIQQQQLEWQTRMMSHVFTGGANPDDYRGTIQSQPSGLSHSNGYQAQDGTNLHPNTKAQTGAHHKAARSADYLVPASRPEPPVVKYQLATPIPEASKKPIIRTTHSTQTSPLDTPAPRRRPPLPMSKDMQPRTGRPLLEEILRKDAEANGSNQNLNETMDGSFQADHIKHKQR